MDQKAGSSDLDATVGCAPASTSEAEMAHRGQLMDPAAYDRRGRSEPRYNLAHGPALSVNDPNFRSEKHARLPRRSMFQAQCLPARRNRVRHLLCEDTRQ